MSNWWPLIWIIWIIAASVAAISACLYGSVRLKSKNNSIPNDFADTCPSAYDYTRVDPNIEHPLNVPVAASPYTATQKPEDTTSVVLIENRPALAQPDPAIKMAQDNLNYKLWHKLLWLIPNTTWLQTQHQSLVEIQWLCLGPDHYCFVARAELQHDEWTWSFTKA